MKIDKSKIIKYLICFYIAFSIFNFKSYNIVNSDNNIGIYKNYVVFKEYNNISFTPLVIFDLKKAGDSKKYFYGVLKLNISKFKDCEDFIEDPKKYLTYDNSESTNYKYVFDNNKISYFIFNKEKKLIEVFKEHEELKKNLKEKGVKPMLYPLGLFKIFKTHRKLRTHTYIFELNSINNLYFYEEYTRCPIINGGL